MSKRSRGRRKPVDTAQRGLGFALQALPLPDPVPVDRYETGRDDQFIGDIPLEEYLSFNGLKWVVRLSKAVRGLDYSSLTKGGANAQGRRSTHPRIFIGLIVYGMLLGRTSLRELERLATADLGAWLICGGLRPDHSTIGKFIVRTSEALSDEFFVSTTAQLVKALKLSSSIAGIDGTVVESAASRFGMLKKEAAERAATEARAAAKLEPDNAEVEKKAERAEQVVKALEKRSEKLREYYANTSKVCVAPSDPDAVLQPRKDGPRRPAYKPSIIVHESQLILGQHVDPSSEEAAVSALLDQHEKVVGEKPVTLVADGQYENIQTVAECVNRDIDVLTRASSPQEDSANGSILKRHFVYEASKDAYRCPAGKLLPFLTHRRERGNLVRLYRGTVCGACPLRARCTTSPLGRGVRRYDGDEMMEELEKIVEHPDARRKLAQRKAIVEPPFARLKLQQGLTRFRRRGLKLVRAEFALHCLASNLRMALARSFGRVLFVLYAVLTGMRALTPKTIVAR